MNSSIRSVIRLKSPSIKLLWLLIYNLYATGRLIDQFGKAAIDVFLPQSVYEVPLMFLGAEEIAGGIRGISRFGQIRRGISTARDVARVRHNIQLSNGLRVDLKAGFPGRMGHFNKVTQEMHGFPHVHDPNVPGGVRDITADDYINIFKELGE